MQMRNVVGGGGLGLSMAAGVVVVAGEAEDLAGGISASTGTATRYREAE
jgi:formylmethanofuran dehydrogenase subunit C